MNLPPYSIFPNVDNERVLLRQIQPSDIKHLIEISYYNAVQAETETQAREMQDRIDKDYLNGNSIHWGIADKLSDKIVGTCGYYRGFENASGELGCVLLPMFRGKGYMSAAMQLAIDFGLSQLKLQRIWAATNRDNLDAIKLLTRVNLQKLANQNNLEEIEFELKMK